MTEAYIKLKKCYDAIRTMTDFEPDVALVLGSGLGNYAQNLNVIKEISYSELPDFPVSTVPGHDGKFILGTLGDKKVICMKGRVHYYEGYPITDVVLPIRLMGMMGAKILFVTNASGGMGDGMKAGDFMLITDHVSIFAPNPLIGPNMDELGTRFPDMSHVYNKDLGDVIRSVAKDNAIDLQEGVYAQLTGPSFESPAEIQLLKKLGVDAVGMSTVVETIVANHMGMKICGISCVCNLAAGISPTPLTHDEVQEAARIAAPKFTKLITDSILKFEI